MIRALAPASLLLALVIPSASCVGDDAATSESDATETATSTSTSTSTTDATETASTTAGEPADLLECAANRVCGIVSAFSGDPGNPEPTAYTADHVCALQALEKGEPIQIHYSDGCEGMCYGSLIHVRGDRSVIVSGYYAVFDGGQELDGLEVELEPFAESELCTLKPASYFTACLAAFDKSCASESNWVEGCAKPAPAACEA